MRNKKAIPEKKLEVLTILSECYAIKTIACRKAKISRTQFYEWLKDDIDFALKVRELEEGCIDYVETKLVEMISVGDRAATMFYLKAKAKNRGYK